MSSPQLQRDQRSRAQARQDELCDQTVPPAASSTRLSWDARNRVWERDGGACGKCGRPGEEIDHIHGQASDINNLQLLRKDCHHAKTAERMVPVREGQRKLIAALYAKRVQPDIPGLLADDEVRWQKEWSALKKSRRERLLDDVREMDLDLADFRGATRAEMVAALGEAIEDEQDELADALDPGGWTEDEDSGYGPYNYFAHAMARDD